MADWRFETAAVIGTGMMGPGIALTLALGGVKTVIVSRSEDGAAEGLARARSQLLVLEQNGLAGPTTASAVAGLLSASADFDSAIAAAGLVIESAPEDMRFKQELFARMDAIAGPGAALATNTSGLSVTSIAAHCKRPERVITTHFWNPPHLMPLVEIVRGDRTDPSLAEALKSLLRACGKSPVIVKRDTPGQLGNRLQMALVREAIHIVESGIAGVEEVDLAARRGFGLRLPAYGIFEHQDAVGLDMALGILNYVSQDLYNAPRAPQLMHDMVARGELGAKSGKGFYDWSEKSIDEVRARRDRFVLDMLKRERGGPA